MASGAGCNKKERRRDRAVWSSDAAAGQNPHDCSPASRGERGSRLRIHSGCVADGRDRRPPIDGFACIARTNRPTDGRGRRSKLASFLKGFFEGAGRPHGPRRGLRPARGPRAWAARFKAITSPVLETKVSGRTAAGRAHGRFDREQLQSASSGRPAAGVNR